jgi:hypothetical protein
MLVLHHPVNKLVVTAPHKEDLFVTTPRRGRLNTALLNPPKKEIKELTKFDYKFDKIIGQMLNISYMFLYS